MKKKLYLHIGSPKSGSSAIETFLSRNWEHLLLQHGVYYVRVEQSPYECDVWTQTNICRASNARTILSLMAKECSRHPDCDIVISSQSLSMISTWNDTFLTHCDTELLKTIQELFPDHSLKIVYYVRRLDDFAKALFNTYLKVGFQRHPFRLPTQYPEFFEVIRRPDEPFGLHPHRFIEQLVAQLGEENVILRIYDRSTLKNGDSIDDFLDILGIDPAEFAERRREDINPRVPDASLALLSCLYECAGDIDRTYLKKLSRDIVAEYAKPSASIDDESLRQEFDEEIERIDSRLPGYKALFAKRRCSFDFPGAVLDPKERFLFKLLISSVYGDAGAPRKGIPRHCREGALFVNAVQDLELIVLGKILESLGYEDRGMIASDFGYQEYHGLSMQVRLQTEKLPYQELPYAMQAVQTDVGQFLAGHVEADAFLRVVGMSGSGMLMLRDLRESVLAAMHSWNAGMEREDSRLEFNTYNICVFLLSHQGFMIGRNARECCKLLSKLPIVRFEDVFSSDPARTRASVDNLILATGAERERVMDAVSKAAAAPSLQFVHDLPGVASCWNEEIESVFCDLRLNALNEELGYSRVWRQDGNARE